MRSLRILLSIFLTCASPLLAQDFTTLKGHGGPVMGLTVSEDGQVASASFDNSLGLWDGRFPTWLEGHDAAVTAIHFADGVLLSGSDDFRVLGWHPKLSAPIEIAQHGGKVSDIAYFKDEQIIASSSWDGTIAIRRVIAPLGNGDPVDPVEFSEATLNGHNAGVNAVAFSQTTGALYSASSDGTIRVWDVAEGTSRAIVKHGFGVNRIVVSDTGNWLAYGAVDGVTRVVDLTTEKELRDFTLERRPILSMAFHAETAQLAVGDGHGYIMMVDTGNWKITHDFRATQTGPVWALAFSPDAGLLYAGGLDDVIYGWPIAALDTFEPSMSGDRSFLRPAATMPNGERQFMRKCSICHALDAGTSRKAGPTLHNVFGRAAGTVDGYNYSPILTGSDIVWSETTIDALFDLGPDHYIPGSKMPMQRITSPKDRDDLIAFLKTATMLGEQDQ